VEFGWLLYCDIEKVDYDATALLLMAVNRIRMIMVKKRIVD